MQYAKLCRTGIYADMRIIYFQSRYGISNFDFYDLTAIIKKSWIIEFCKLVILRNLKFTWQIPAGTRSEAINEEVAFLLYKAGCTFITYAPESGSEEILKLIRKKVSLQNMLQSIKFSHKNGLNVKLNIIIGFPEETHKTLLQTLLFHVKSAWNGADDMSPAVFHPYPGSAYFRQLLLEGKINLSSDEYFKELVFVNYFGKVVFYTNNISDSAMKIYVFLNLFVFYSAKFIFRPYQLFSLLHSLFLDSSHSRLSYFIKTVLKRKKSLNNKPLGTSSKLLNH